uniref:Uncharacterized protein n=1 Tax=Anguilla anguilla TaxID=7936 RepID=A0A0E9QYL0_ANGAN
MVMTSLTDPHSKAQVYARVCICPYWQMCVCTLANLKIIKV